MEDHGFSPVIPEEIGDNLISLIESDWMLVTAGSSDKFNTMTANWGGMGYLWNKPVVFVFVRPERYTYGFMEKSDGFTLTFFGEEYRDALNLCGSRSGRDCDKVKETGLTPIFTGSGYPAFAEARIIVECRKLYSDLLNKESFIADELPRKHYSKGGLHKMYIAEISNVWIR